MLLPAGIMDEMELQFHLVHAATLMDYTRSCKYSQMLLMKGENIARNT